MTHAPRHSAAGTTPPQRLAAPAPPRRHPTHASPPPPPIAARRPHSRCRLSTAGRPCPGPCRRASPCRGRPACDAWQQRCCMGWSSERATAAGASGAARCRAARPGSPAACSAAPARQQARHRRRSRSRTCRPGARRARGCARGCAPCGRQRRGESGRWRGRGVACRHRAPRPARLLGGARLVGHTGSRRSARPDPFGGPSPAQPSPAQYGGAAPQHGAGQAGLGAKAAWRQGTPGRAAHLLAPPPPPPPAGSYWPCRRASAAASRADRSLPLSLPRRGRPNSSNLRGGAERVVGSERRHGLGRQLQLEQPAAACPPAPPVTQPAAPPPSRSQQQPVRQAPALRAGQVRAGRGGAAHSSSSAALRRLRVSSSSFSSSSLKPPPWPSRLGWSEPGWPMPHWLHLLRRAQFMLPARRGGVGGGGRLLAHNWPAAHGRRRKQLRDDTVRCGPPAACLFNSGCSSSSSRGRSGGPPHRSWCRPSRPR
jgi:hypothetical protein